MGRKLESQRKSQQRVIRDYGGVRFRALVGEAVVILKEDGRLVGLDKLRCALAVAACMRAVTGEVRAFVVPRKFGWNDVSPEWCGELVAACALRLRLDGKA